MSKIPIKRWEFARLQANMKGLKKGEHFSDDLKLTGKERGYFGWNNVIEQDNEVSKRTIQDMFHGSLLRDYTMDMENARQELPKFGKYVDEIPPFDSPAGSLLKPSDYAAKQQIELIVRSRKNFLAEEQRFDRDLEDRDKSIEPQPLRREADRREQLRLARENQRQTTSTL